ncbi:probable MGM1 - Mitochondrial GTPase related to dynamin [Moesziomyces antarcticus]|nr:probable MGM1 - Mitochondrial GTPase related to dynamin [Moesziomyces antarcticus]
MSTYSAATRAAAQRAGHSRAASLSSPIHAHAGHLRQPLMRFAAHRPGAPDAHFAAHFTASSSGSRLMHVRAISFNSVPKAAFRAVRLPAYGLAAGGGALAYANYKVDEFKDMLGRSYGRLSDRAKKAYSGISELGADALENARDSWEALSERLDAIELPDTPGFLRNLFSGFSGSQSSEDVTTKWSAGGGGSGGPDPNGTSAMAGAAAVVASSLFGDDEASTDGTADATSKTSTEELMLLTRKLIEVRNILKDIDHESDQLTLPSIVVIGSQSSGKSSVLEAIVGHEFLPKGNNMVTRRPIELTLIHTPAQPGRAAIKDTLVEYAEFPGLGLGRITDFSHVQKTLYDLNMAVPAAECVSDEPIELRIHSPHVPDLTLIDLPGYVQIASMDQPDELRERIQTLCQKYIQEPNIILAVCAADVDLANSPALRASRQVDPLGLRTIGVVTKMDLVPPEVGAAILSNNKYPLSLGYVGVVCKSSLGMFQSAQGHDRAGQGRMASMVTKQESDYFNANREHFKAPARGRNAGVEPMTGTDTLRRRLMTVLEESMGSSLHGIANAVQVELEEASYQFKVQYNDRTITAESYAAETMDALKLRFNQFAAHFGKPEVRALLKHALDEKVMDILAQMYWSDARTPELAQLADARKLAPDQLDKYWQYKLDASSSALTKAGIGRMSTQLVVDAIRTQIEHLARSEPFNHHPEAAERIVAFSSAILRERFGLTADQVENCVKPFKYEVEVEPAEWEAGRQRSVSLVERELDMCDAAFNGIKKLLGGRRLKGAMEYVTHMEERERRRVQARLRAREESADASTDDADDDSNDPTRPDYNSALLIKAREALFLSERSRMLRTRLGSLRSRRCKSGPETKAFCPETFLNIVAEKLTYTAVMFINIELLAEFFYQFPREIDAKLMHHLDADQLKAFARENPAVKKHLDLQTRKQKLEHVAGVIGDLVKVYKQKNTASRWAFF